MLPIDIHAIGLREAAKAKVTNWDSCKLDKYYVTAVHEAINNKVDAISLSSLPRGASTRGYTNALKEAANKGIALIVGAGNGSNKKKAVFLGRTPDQSASISHKSDTKMAFEELKGKNMLFCGSLGYTEKGKETFSEFSEHPAQDTLIRYVLAPGENVFIQKNNKQYRGNGTSFSAPVTAGKFALLKQYAKDKGLVHTTDDLLKILHTSGHNLNHNIPGTPFNTYKVLNLHNAMQGVDRLITPPKPLSAAKKAVVQPPKKQVTLVPKGRVAARKTPVQTVKKATAVRKGPVAVKKAPVQTTKKPVVPKGLVTAKKTPVQTAKRRIPVAKKGRVVVKKASIRKARKAALARKRRATFVRLQKKGGRNTNPSILSTLSPRPLN
jgi:hypothetical protein